MCSEPDEKYYFQPVFYVHYQSVFISVYIEDNSFSCQY